MPWKAGVSGNPGGRLKKVSKLLRLATKHAPKAMAYALALLEEPDISEDPKDMLTQRKIRLEAGKLLMAYGIGTPPKLSEDADKPSSRRSPLDGLSVEELRALARRPVETPDDGSAH